jgi:hypothetical protein
VTAGNSLASGDDVRIVFWDGGNNTQLDRLCDPTSFWNNASTKVWFRLPGAVSAGGSDTNYWLYYKHSGAGSPPVNGTNVYQAWDDFSGTSVNAAVWDTYNAANGTLSVTGGWLRISCPTTGDWYGTSDTSPYIVSKSALGTDFVADALIVTNGNSVYNRFFGLRSGPGTTEKMFCLLTDDNGSHINTVWRDAVSGSAGYQNNDTGVANPGNNKVAKFIRMGDTATAYYNDSQANSRTIAS